MAGIEIVNEVPTPTCPKCGKPADLEARSGMWIHDETSSPRCAKGAAEAVPLTIVEQSYKLQCAVLEKTVQDLRAQVAELRSEVARLEGLRARCERWIEWQLWTRCATPSEGTALLADLRAGQDHTAVADPRAVADRDGPLRHRLP